MLPRYTASSQILKGHTMVFRHGSQLAAGHLLIVSMLSCHRILNVEERG